MGFTFCVCVCMCYRTQGMHVREELSSVAEISTIATDVCILLFLHSCHQVSWTHTHFCSHRFSHSEILPHFKAWVALQTGSLRQPWVVMGSDSLNCYKPQCGAGVKWHMLLRGPGVGVEKQVIQTRQACLFSHPLMKRTASPRGLLEFLALGRMWDICPSVTLQQTHTHTVFLLPVFAYHTLTITFFTTPHTFVQPSSKQWQTDLSSQWTVLVTTLLFTFVFSFK